jgi:hypothetical protein
VCRPQPSNPYRILRRHLLLLPPADMIADEGGINNTVNPLGINAGRCSCAAVRKSCKMCLLRLQVSGHGFRWPAQIGCARRMTFEAWPCR